MTAEPIAASVYVAAPPERVFEHFVHPELMVRWMGEHAVLEATPGGTFLVDIRGVPVRGRYLELDPPHRLVVSWGHAGSERLPPGASRVEIRLRAVGGGTRVEIVHHSLPEPERSGHPRGWRHFLARLAVTAAGGDPGPDTIVPPRRATGLDLPVAPTELTSTEPPRRTGRKAPSAMSLDRLAETGPSLAVAFLEDTSIAAGSSRGPREPHRHDYHELIWTRTGTGRHLIDGDPSPVIPHTVTLIGRGQVHVFERAEAVTGAAIRFGEELLHQGAAARASPGWLLGWRGSRTVQVPAAEVKGLEATIETLAAESRRPLDECTLDLQRHLISVILLWVERWYDASRAERDVADPDVQLYRRFVALLERDFARHHETGHYADSLAVPPALLSRALSRVAGRTTKELITERVMLEAARLLRFSDLTVGEVAFRAGFGDQLYFSRAFKRHRGEAPTAYRGRLRGRA